MEEFRKNFSLYSSVLYFTALWPYDQSLLRRIQRVALPMVFSSLLVIQISTLKSVEKSLDNVLMMLSMTCPMTLYVLRYVGFTICLPTIRVMFDRFSNDYNATKDPVELDIFARKIIEAKRVFLAYLGLTAVLVVYFTVILVIPTILRSKVQLKYLHILGFFYPEMSRQTDLVSFLFVFVNVMGLLSIASTESSIAVCGAYLCGMLEIASYRIEIAIDNVVHSNTSELIQVRPVVELHKRVTTTLNDMMDDMTVPYLIAIVTVIVSFAVNLFRVSITENICELIGEQSTPVEQNVMKLFLFCTHAKLLLALQKMNSFSNIFFSVNDVLLHFAIMFLNNLSGQRLINTSSYIFNKICNSAWYCIPLRSQKILLFMMMNSVKEMHCNLAGFYDLGYEGFSMMMSSSFSYFTVMCSTQ